VPSLPRLCLRPRRLTAVAGPGSPLRCRPRRSAPPRHRRRLAYRALAAPCYESGAVSSRDFVWTSGGPAPGWSRVRSGLLCAGYPLPCGKACDARRPPRQWAAAIRGSAQWRALPGTAIGRPEGRTKSGCRSPVARVRCTTSVAVPVECSRSAPLEVAVSTDQTPPESVPPRAQVRKPPQLPARVPGRRATGPCGDWPSLGAVGVPGAFAA